MKIRRLCIALFLATLVNAPSAQAGWADPHHFGRPAVTVRAGGEAPGPKLKNTRLVSHFDPGGGFHADVVEHGRFAYLGSWGTPDPEGPPTSRKYCPSRGVRVIDIHDPSKPKLVATFADGKSTPQLAGSWTEKVIVEHVDTRWFEGALAAVSIQTCAEGGFAGFGLWDVTRPRKPRLLALYETPGTLGSHELWLDPRGDKAYVYTAIILSELTTSPTFDPKRFNATTPGEPDFRIIDVSNPQKPVKVGEWGAWKELGIHPRAGFGNAGADNFVHSVVAFGSRAYLSYWDLGTVILDVSNPRNPRFLGRTQFPQNPADDEGNAHSAWIAKNGRILIQTDEDFNPAPGNGTEAGWGHPRFYDISNPRRPRRVSILMLPSTKQLPPPAVGDFTVHDPKVRGDTVYFSWYSEGVVVVDIENVRRPRVVAQFVPPPAPDPTGFFPEVVFKVPPATPFVEVWGVFLHRDVVLASDMNSGLWIFKVRRRGGDD